MTMSSLHVLAIDDDRLALRVLEKHLEALDGWSIKMRGHSDWREGLDDLRTQDVHVIFLDYQLGSSNGIEVLAKLRSSGDLRPVIVLTGAGDERVAAKITRTGADDYLVKGQFNSDGLARAIRNVRERYRLRLQKRDLEEQLRKLATRDGLTGVFNRFAFEEFLSAEWRRAARSQRPLSLLLIDVDRFKEFNDTYGHPSGDECLVRLAAAFQSTLRRPGDRLARYGGEEFAVLLPETDGEGARYVAGQIVESAADLEMEHRTSDSSKIVTVSCGVATALPTFNDPRCEGSLVRAADEALYRAKDGGRNRYEEAGRII